jgi:hypothetical protein
MRSQVSHAALRSYRGFMGRLRPADAQPAMFARDGITMRPNKELKLTKPGKTGALQLNSSVGQS